MCCEAVSVSAKSRGRRTAIGRLALVLCVLFVAALLLSSVYLSTHAGHTHDHDGPGGGCAACMHLQAAQTLLKQLATAVAAVTAALGGLLCALFLLGAPAPRLGFLTLVTLKVQLNN